MNFNYFYVNNPGSVSRDSYPEVIPFNKGNTLVDVYKDHYWQLTKNIDEVPYIILKEYKLEYGRWTASLIRILKTVKGLLTENKDTADIYSNMYIGEPTGFSYRLPYLVNPGTSIRGSLINQWSPESGDVTGNMFPGIKSLVDTIGAGLTPGWGTEDLYKYASTSNRRLRIQFPLYNTQDLVSLNDNFSFITLFNLQNLKTRTSWTTYLPPKVYSVDTAADGGIYMPMAWVESFEVTTIGQLRDLKDIGGSSNFLMDSFGSFIPGAGRLIPEGYMVAINLVEALPESANIMAGVLGGKRVSVISARPQGSGRQSTRGSEQQNLGPSAQEYAIDNINTRKSNTDSFLNESEQQYKAQAATSVSTLGNTVLTPDQQQDKFNRQLQAAADLARGGTTSIPESQRQQLINFIAGGNSSEGKKPTQQSSDEKISPW